MIERASCPKCESNRIIPNAHINSPGQYGGNLYIPVSEHPEAHLFKATHIGKLRAWICGNCGFTELYVENHAELYDAYEASRQP